jgi:hypothetical protein
MTKFQNQMRKQLSFLFSLSISRSRIMKRFACVAVVLCVFLQGTCPAEIVVQVYPSLAPNALGSANWSGYQTKAIYAIENGLSVNGDSATDPTAYQRAPSTLDAGQVAVTSFPSWLGVADPPSPFQNEYGNRLHFGLHVLGNGTKFSISEMSFTASSSDTTNSLGFSWGLGTYNYGAGHVGINYGADGIKGTSDDVRITSGANTQLVDELVSRGSGNAWWPGGDAADPANPPGGRQASINDLRSWAESEKPISVMGSYTVQGVTGSASVNVVPEPGTSMLLIAGGLTGLAVWARRRLGK